MLATREAINIKEVRTYRHGVCHRQIFIWSDENARAMQDRILEQQRLSEYRRGWRCLRIATGRRWCLLAVVLSTAKEVGR